LYEVAFIDRLFSMLTRDDLEQIRSVFQDEIKTSVRAEVRDVIREEVRIIVKEEVKTSFKEEVRETVKEEVSVQLKPVNRKLNRIQKDIRWIMRDYTNAIVHVRKRVERLENHAGFSS